MNILFQFNEKYAPYSCVAMTSLFENNKLVDDITVYALIENVLPETMDKIERNAISYGRKIVFLQTDKLVEEMEALGIPKYRGSYSANFKMFVDRFIGDDVDRILYLDSDVIVEDSLQYFYNSDLNGNAIAMTMDTLGMRHKMQIGFNADEDYFNTGVILFDLKKWRESKCEEKIVEFIKNSNRDYPAPDQDIINLALKDEIYRADLRYNIQPHHMIYLYDELKNYFYNDSYYSKDEVEVAMASPVILHTYRFLGEFPWHLESLHPASPRFDHYLEKSVYRGLIKIKTDNQGFMFRVERWLYKVISKKLFLKVFTLNFTYFFYKANKLSKKRKTSDQM